MEKKSCVYDSQMLECSLNNGQLPDIHIHIKNGWYSENGGIIYHYTNF